VHGRVALIAVLAAVLGPGAAAARAGSLYSGPGPRPGPDLLYAGPADAPQLENTGVWKAPPILVSGAEAYRDGEWLYQDFLYDDHGAREAPDPNDPRAPGDSFSLPNGTYTYPSDPRYAANAADLVELRLKPLADRTAFRVTLNTMKDPALTAFTIAIGDGPVHAWPAGANVSSPAALFLTVHGTTAGLVRADGGAAVSPAPVVTVDRTRRQIEVDVPHAAWDPGRGVVRLAAGVGLWDAAAGRYLVPQAASDATHPGGAGSASAPAALFNVAFRTHEPFQDISTPAPIVDDPAWWRDHDQGHALAGGDVSAFHADVDFGKLARRTDDESGVPQTGAMDRILASHFETAQGVAPAQTCSSATGPDCTGPFVGRLQPYAIYVPKGPRPAGGWPLTLLMHALFTNYNMYLGTRNQSQLGDRGDGSIVITPEARGPDGGYTSYAEADVFDVWNDVARRFALDPGRVALTGYSMGAIGTFQLAEQFPDLFGVAESTSGADETGETASLRNVPMLMWNMAGDEEVTADKWEKTASDLDALGYRYELDTFAPGEHNTFFVEDQFAPVAAFLGRSVVDRDPAHVTYAVSQTALDRPKLGVVADHAYWLSAVTPRAKGGAAQVDAVSSGFGEGDPVAAATQRGSATLSGGAFPFPTLAYTRQYKTWGAAPSAPKADALTLTASNVGAVTVSALRARLTCGAKVTTHSDGPLVVHWTDCGAAAARAAGCASRRSLRITLPRARRGDRYARARVRVGAGKARPVRVSRRHQVSVSFAGRPKGRVRVLVRATTRRHHVVTVRRSYRLCVKR
jgi:hypothetical protein